MNIIVPLGGIGSRFKDMTDIPKPLIPIHGTPMVKVTLNHFIAQNNIKLTKLYFITINSPELDEELKRLYPACEIISLSNPTEGALQTLNLGIKKGKIAGRFISLDCDLMLTASSLKNTPNHALITFEADSSNYSYVKSKNGKAIEIKEKEVISNSAIAGAYFFPDAQKFLELSSEIINKNIKAKGEFYISVYFAELLRRGEEVDCFKSDLHISYGTPEELDYNSELIKDSFS